MNYKKKYITTTLPYINSVPHIGHAFEFCLADVIADFSRSFHGQKNVKFNVGVDEHGQKIAQKELNYPDIQSYCDEYATKWKDFCSEFQIDYSTFYRTTDPKHEEQVLQFFEDIHQFLYRKTNNGRYCVGCESFKTEKDIVDNKCIVHKIELTDVSEENTFFKLSEFGDQIKNILTDPQLSKELANLLKEKFDLPITRQNVDWAIQLNDEETIYVWFDALLNYIFAIGFYEDRKKFDELGEFTSNLW